MTGVKHMKWWGWGVEGVAFHHEDKPKLAPFVLQAVGLDLNAAQATPALDFSTLDVPGSKLPIQLRDELIGAVGETYVITDDEDRVVHTYGKSLRDLLRIRANVLPRVPDVVVYPADEDQVRAVVEAVAAADAVLIPFGGGSNISGSLEPRPAETRPVVSLDMGRLNRVLEIDADSQMARVQAGVQGPDLEEQLTAQGWTMGHFPDSFTHSTLGGWVATRSSGMQSDKYGDIAGIVRGMRAVQPGGTVVVRPLPSTSTGPSIREMLLGSEGRLGVITEVTVQVHRIPAERTIQAYLFRDWESGLAAMREIAESDAHPSITRVSDARETGFSFATSKESKGVSKYATDAMMKFLELRGWDLSQLCLSFIGYEGSKTHVSMTKAIVDGIVKRNNGIGVGTGPGKLYDQKKFDTPYIRDFLLDRGASADVSETAAPWGKLQQVYDNTVAAANKAYDQLGVKGWIMCHLSHSYHTGACLYFTFAYVSNAELDPIDQYDTVKKAIQQSFVDNGGTLSHHHAVGVEHSPWMEQDVSTQGVTMMRGLFVGVDPKENLNPGKILLDD